MVEFPIRYFREGPARIDSVSESEISLDLTVIFLSVYGSMESLVVLMARGGGKFMSF